jgi:thioesterase domain-containing protein
VPRVVHFVERLERDPNGKVDRKRLRHLANGEVPVPEPASSTLECEWSTSQRLVLDVWQQVLQVPSLTPESDFFASGGHSLLALEVAHRLGRALSREVPLSTLYRCSTAAALAHELEGAVPASTDYEAQDPLAPCVVLAPGSGVPLVCVHPAGGLAWCYLGLSPHLPGTTLLGLQDPGFSGSSPSRFEGIVHHHLETLLRAQPEGPYRLLGWSSGGGIAHALACELESLGKQVSFVAMLDAFPADIWHGTPEPTELDALVSMLDDVDASPTKPNGELYTHDELLARLKAPGSSLAAFDDATIHKMWRATYDSMRIYRSAKHAIIQSDVHFFRAARRRPKAPEAFTWSPYVEGRFTLTDIDSTHLGMCEPKSLERVAARLSSLLR